MSHDGKERLTLNQSYTYQRNLAKAMGVLFQGIQILGASGALIGGPAYLAYMFFVTEGVISQ